MIMGAEQEDKRHNEDVIMNSGNDSVSLIPTVEPSSALNAENASLIKDAKRKRNSRDLEVERRSGGPEHGEAARSPAGEGQMSGPPSMPDPKRARVTLSTVNEHEHSLLEPLAIHGLPPIIWTKVFSLLPPVFLGRLLRVSRGFHSLLTFHSSGFDAFDVGEVPNNDASVQSIWLASHRKYAAGLPSAQPGQTELHMWRLIRGASCQLCRKQMPLLSTSDTTDPWLPSTENGARVVWPFGVRCCPACLSSQIQEESSLLFSSMPSILLPCLPYIFLADGTRYVTSMTVKNSPNKSGAPPSKAYYKSHIKQLQSEFERIKKLDPETAKAWVTKLEKERETRTEAVLTWENWESKGGLRKVNARPNIKHLPTKATVNTPTLQKAIEEQSNSSPRKTDLQSMPSGLTQISVGSVSSKPSHSPATPEVRGQSPGSGTGTLPPRPASNTTSYRPERSLQDVTIAKVERKSDIERRCMDLVPPITPDVLRHMDSYQAALQIPQALTEQAWALLLPRLLDQREEAEKEEQNLRQRHNPSQDLANQLSQPDQEERKDVMQRTWEATQAPVRDRLRLYADEQIRDRWSNGTTVTKENCSAFAADVLLHVKRRFDLEQEAKSGSPNQSDIQEDNVLILENMKWIFDSKIRPLTDQYQREIFLCSACEGSSKYYGFEAVIQHYAAKHTSALSQGSVVVHWRANWPDQPPFHPNPGLVKSSQAISAVNPYTFQNPVAAQEPPHTVAEVQGYPRAGPWNVDQPSGYTQPSVVQAIGGHPHQPQSLPGVPSYPVTYNGSSFTNSTNSLQYVPAVTPNSYSLPAAPPASHTAQWPQGPFSTIVAPSGDYAAANQLHQYQMNDMAKHARDVWFNISGVKDMPASVRIHVVIYHTVTRFAKTHGVEPTAAMFLEGLNQNPLMRPVRSLNGLTCRTCASNEASRLTNYQSPQPHVSEKRSFTLPLLLNHFKTFHIEQSPKAPAPGVEPQKSNWTNDMVELPTASVILNLINASGMDDNKVMLIALAIPGIFPNPLPKAHTYRGPAYGRSETISFGGDGMALPIEHSVSVHQVNTTKPVTDSRGDPGENGQSVRNEPGMEAVGDDEYDPHRPAHLGRIVDSRKISQGERSLASPSLVSSPAYATYIRTAASSEQFLDLGGNETHASSRQIDYDPNQPIVRYDTVPQDARLHTARPQNEFSEADRFLDNLQPDLQRIQDRRGAAVPSGNAVEAVIEDGFHRTLTGRAPAADHVGSHDRSPVYIAHEPRTAHSFNQHPKQIVPKHAFPHSQQTSRPAHEHVADLSPYPPLHHDTSEAHRGWQAAGTVPREPSSASVMRHFTGSEPLEAARGEPIYRVQHAESFQEPAQSAPQVRYVYAPELSHAADPHGRREAYERRVEYIAVDDYHREPRFHEQPRTTSGAHTYVLEQPQITAQSQPRDLGYGDDSYSTHARHTGSESRTMYREH